MARAATMVPRMQESDIPDSPLDLLLGTQWGEMTEKRATATLEVRPDHTQPAGLVHGGIYATLAESVTSRATSICAPEGHVGLGQSNSTTFLRPVSSGRLNVVATRIHGGRTTWIWDVSISDGDDRLCAVSRVTIAVRPLQR